MCFVWQFRSSQVSYWFCDKCPMRQTGTTRREVEWPELRCYGKHVTVEIPPGEGMPTRQRLVVNEEDVRNYIPGVRWHVGQWVQVREMEGQPWRHGQVVQFKRCNAKMGHSSTWHVRHADCFVLLLTRDGSHGLDLSKASDASRML